MSAQPALFDLQPAVFVPDRTGRAKVTRRRVRQILTKATGLVSSFDYTLNPYVGCAFGCAYCYAAFFQPDEEKAKDWGYWVEVKENALELLRQERRLAGSHVLVGSVTDPYQPVERQTRLTRSLLDHMSRLRPQPRIHVQTRSPLVADDTDLLLRFESLTVGLSITTDSDEVRKRYEPGCASIGRRLGAVKALAESGVKVTVALAPLLPVRDVDQFAQMIRDTGADRVWAGYFHPGTRKFASGTRENALVLAKEDGWNFERYVETVSALKRRLPNFRRE